eukprot:8355553-Pyramimonas_sp.AAC.1
MTLWRSEGVCSARSAGDRPEHPRLLDSWRGVPTDGAARLPFTPFRPRSLRLPPSTACWGPRW